MINVSNEKLNNNYLNDYVDYYINKERDKFSKLKYTLFSIKNFKKISNIESKNKYLPNINKKTLSNDKSKKIITNKYLESIIKSQKILGRNIKNDLILSKILDTNWTNYTKKNEINEPNQNNNIKIIDNQNYNNDLNLNSNTQKENITNNNYEYNKIHNKSNKELRMNNSKIKRNISHETINSNFSNKKSIKNLVKDLNKEIINPKRKLKKKITLNIKDIDDYEEFKDKKRKIIDKIKLRKEIEKEEEKIIDSLYIGHNIINNCKIKNKTIYDIKPLNKTKEKASCRFPSSYNSEPKNLKTNIISKKPLIHKNINKNTHSITQRILKYFKNSYNQVSSDYRNNNKIKNIQIKRDEEIKKENNDNEYNKIIQKTISSNKDEISEREIIKNFSKDENENDMNELLNNNNKKEFKKKNYIRNWEKYKNKQLYIDLSYLAKEINNKKKIRKNMRSFISRDGRDVMRGEKIKFLKTYYKVKHVKPVLSQQLFKFNTLETSKKKIISQKAKKYPINHYKLDILNRENIKEINNAENILLDLKKNINMCLNNFLEKLEKQALENK